MRIAIIGSGIAGMTAAYRLNREHDITVFEANAYAGGHTHTVDIEAEGRSLAIDTGFIVFNDWTYKHFIALLDELKVAWQPSDMSFSVRCDKTGLEYNGTRLNSLFAQRRNLARPSFLRMVADILRFNREAPAMLLPGAPLLTLGEYLERQRYSRYFIEHYIIPMGSAIWSSSPGDMLGFSARFFIEFFSNHGFLSVNERPTWRVIQGGSREYARALTAPYRRRIRLNTPVASVERRAQRISVRLRDGNVEHFDRVFFACHSDQALHLLSDPSAQEREILSAMPYQENEALLHTDTRLLPRRRLAWAAWNYHLPLEPQARATVTYNMNILQSLDTRRQFLLTLNRSEAVDPSKVLGRYVYHHPLYTAAAVAAQKRHPEINGQRGTFYCGAYWGYGFHEDGVKSALAALAEFERQEHAQPYLQRVG